MGLSEQLNKYKNAEEFFWCQEEPRNAGCWSFMQPRFKNILGLDLIYAGRPELPSPAVGIGSMHKIQLESIEDDLANSNRPNKFEFLISSKLSNYLFRKK